jgi:hypothetical protein
MTRDLLERVVKALFGQVSTGTYSLPNDTNENDALTFTTNKKRRLRILFDLNNLVQNIEVREYHKVDGTNYRQTSFKTWTTDFDTGAKALEFDVVQMDCDYKITITSVVAQGAAKDIPYRYMWETRV